MRLCRNTWAVVLAAGDGTRLARLTTDQAGNAVPKQYCSLNGGGSLLREATQRAGRIVSKERICVIVSEQHRRFWRSVLWNLPEANVVVQPINRGTAHGILLAAVSILTHDPFARIVFLPADHHVRDESALAGSVRSAAALVAGHKRGLALVGIEPDEPDPDLGYIIPGRISRDGSYAVRHFVEKPERSLATRLLSLGALWNSFIFAADGPTLLGLFRQRMAHSLDAIATAVARPDRTSALNEVYEQLTDIDFSRSMVQGAENSLRVVAAPSCGWSDLGTPKRVAEALRKLDGPGAGACAGEGGGHLPATAFINLAAQHARLGLAF